MVYILFTLGLFVFGLLFAFNPKICWAQLSIIEMHQSIELVGLSQHASAEKIEKLIQGGADPNSCDENGKTPLMAAAENGNENALETLLLYGADVNCLDNAKWSALMRAAFWGKLKCIKILLENGADINAIDDGGRSPLLEAIDNSLVEVIDLLLENGADIYIKDNEGMNGLDLASINNDMEVIQLLKSKGYAFEDENNENESDEENDEADVINEDDSEDTDEIDSESYTENNEQLKVEKGRKANSYWMSSHSGFDLMMMGAVTTGNYDALNDILNAGKDVFISNSRGKDLLMIACENGYKDIAELLIEKGADINAYDENYWTPLFYATFNGHIDVVKFLLENGADYNSEDINGKLPFLLTNGMNHQKTFKIFQKFFKKYNIKIDEEIPTDDDSKYSKENNNYLKDSMPKNEKKYKYKEYSMEECANQLINAVKSGKLSTLKRLLSKGYDVNAQDEDGNTALIYAIHKNFSGSVKFLIENGADVSLTNKEGYLAKDFIGDDTYPEVSQLVLSEKKSKKERKEILDNKQNLASQNIKSFAKEEIKQSNKTVNYQNSIEVCEKYLKAVNYQNSIEVCEKFLKAVIDGNLDEVRRMVYAGVNIDYTDEYGSTALIYASAFGNYDIVKFLVKNNAKIDIIDNMDMSAFDYAFEKHYIEIQNFLKYCQRKTNNELVKFNYDEIESENHLDNFSGV